jgi:hypothetical protein
VDRVQAAKVFDREQCRIVEQRVVHANEVEPLNDLSRASGRRRTLMSDRSDHFNSRERARAAAFSSPDERSERRGFVLSYHELHQR